MRFLADMGVSPQVVEWLRSEGHDVTHLRDEGLHRLPDSEVFAKAASEKRVLLTFDLDFGEIASLFRGARTSIIVFRLHNTRAVHVIDRLAAVLSESADALMRSVVVIVEETRYRIRDLPQSSAS